MTFEIEPKYRLRNFIRYSLFAIKGLIASAKAGVIIQRDDLEAFGLAGGNIQNVVNGMIVAKQAGFKLSFNNATKADFQGVDIFKAVKEKLANQQETNIEFE